MGGDNAPTRLIRARHRDNITIMETIEYFTYPQMNQAAHDEPLISILAVVRN